MLWPRVNTTLYRTQRYYKITAHDDLEILEPRESLQIQKGRPTSTVD